MESIFAANSATRSRSDGAMESETREQLNGPEYNNSGFRIVDYSFDTFVGPTAGETFKDFALTDFQTW
jgi:hypothetical protein